jgi:septation ring formation regulator EzrA
MDLVQVFLYIILPLLSGLGSFLLKNMYDRIDMLEKRLRDTMTEQEVRQLLGDKIDPVQDNIKEIKEKIDKLYDFMMNKGS